MNKLFIGMLFALLAGPVLANDYVAAVTNAVCRSVEYKADKGNVWKIAGRTGDCEDIALKSSVALERMGIKSRIVVYKHERLKTFHAALVVDGLLYDCTGETGKSLSDIRPIYIAELRGNSVFIVDNGRGPIAPYFVATVR